MSSGNADESTSRESALEAIKRHAAPLRAEQPDAVGSEAVQRSEFVEIQVELTKAISHVIACADAQLVFLQRSTNGDVGIDVEGAHSIIVHRDGTVSWATTTAYTGSEFPWRADSSTAMYVDLADWGLATGDDGAANTRRIVIEALGRFVAEHRIDLDNSPQARAADDESYLASTSGLDRVFALSMLDYRPLSRPDGLDDHEIAAEFAARARSCGLPYDFENTPVAGKTRRWTRRKTYNGWKFGPDSAIAPGHFQAEYDRGRPDPIQPGSIVCDDGSYGFFRPTVPSANGLELPDEPTPAGTVNEARYAWLPGGKRIVVRWEFSRAAMNQMSSRLIEHRREQGF